MKLAAGRNSQRFATVGNHERRIDDVFHVGASLSEAERDAKSFDSRKKKSREANGQSLAKTVTLTIILDVSLLSHQKRRFPLSFTVVRFFSRCPEKKKDGTSQLSGCHAQDKGGKRETKRKLFLHLLLQLRFLAREQFLGIDLGGNLDSIGDFSITFSLLKFRLLQLRHARNTNQQSLEAKL